MTQWQQAIYNYLVDKTGFDEDNVFNAARSFEKPNGDYATFYQLSDDNLSNSTGTREYNVGTDQMTKDYNPMNEVSLQIDIRGDTSATIAKDLHFSFMDLDNKESLKSNGIYMRGVTSITPLPKFENTTSEEGYIFNMFFGYNYSNTVDKDYATEVTFNGT